MRTPRGAPGMYLIAGLCFLVAGIVGLIGEAGTGFSMGFIALSIAFLVLAYGASQSGHGSSSR